MANKTEATKEGNK